MKNIISKLSITSGLSTEYIIDLIDKSNKNYLKRHVLINGKKRLFYIPSNEIKMVQTLLVELLLSNIEPSAYAQAYVRGRSIKTNVLKHKESKYFYQTDIVSFFPSISNKLIKDKLSKYFSLEPRDMDLVVKVVAPFGRLDLGSASSPIISNIVMKDFDVELVGKLLKNDPGIVYTRYSDDITISSKTEIDQVEITEIIKELLKTYNLNLNSEKTKFTHIKDNVKITGLFLNTSGEITVGTKYKKNLKHQLHLLINGKLTDISTHQIVGKLAFLKDIEPDYHENIILKYSSSSNSVFDYLK